MTCHLTCSKRGHIALTSGHYHPVIMFCSAWLHLFLADSLMLEESNFTWWMVLNGGEAISASCLASELCAMKCNRCPNRLAPDTYLLEYAPRVQALQRLSNYCQSCKDLSACHNVHEAYSLLHYLLVLLNQRGRQFLHYPHAMKNCWLVFKLHSSDDWFIGLRPFMITEINQSIRATPPAAWHVVCRRQKG